VRDALDCGPIPTVRAIHDDAILASQRLGVEPRRGRGVD
jgi:hypothetical protein